MGHLLSILVTLTIHHFTSVPADDDPCASTFCCDTCDPSDLGCSGCGRDTGACEGTVLSCGAGTCYNGGSSCGSTLVPWTGGCCS